jgi:hypothetical protein
MAILLRSTTCATATTTASSSTLLATTFRRGRLLLPARASPARRASAEPLEVCAKASITVPDRLGDCKLSICVGARGIYFCQMHWKCKLLWYL